MSNPAHEVFNQVPALINYNLYQSDTILSEALSREGAQWAEKKVSKYGERVGSEEVIQWGFLANRNSPILHSHDRWGNRIDEVEFHPAYHQLMSLAVEYGLHSSPWKEAKKGAHVARAALMMLLSQNEYGHGCPISMTYAVVPALRKQPDLAKEWEVKIQSTEYDPRFLPMQEKKGVILGMAMTEKQGGSDVRANTTQAVPVAGGGPGGEYSITGHKWFCSAPMSDAFLVLAQAPGGLSCFLLPRWTPDGKRNRFFIQRLKDKMGNRSNASSEVEFDGAYARLVSEEGRGVVTIIEMVNHTRLDCVIGSTGMMRQALVQAIHHATYRSAFGKKLIDQPLMKNVLTDLALESEAATVLMMRLARAYDHQGEPHENAFRRIATAVSKYWVCKRGPNLVVEAVEVHGGNGFIEESIMPRLHREIPLNSIWEGCGNVICLDVLRAMKKEPSSFDALMQEIEKGVGNNSILDAWVNDLKKDLPQLSSDESRARQMVERLALALQGSLLIQNSPSFISEAFCASRLTENWGNAFGTLPHQVDFGPILERARPKIG
jgi:putative acyl-CoA dehydrogenase